MGGTENGQGETGVNLRPRQLREYSKPMLLEELRASN